MSEKDNFSFSGFPTNDEIEIPDSKPSQTRNMLPQFGDPRNFLSDLASMDVEGLKKMLPPTAIKELEDLAQSNNTDLDTLLEGATVTSKKLSSGSFSDMFKMMEDMMSDMLGDYDDEDGCEENCENCNPTRTKYELADIKYLRPEYFGSVECVEDPDSYDNFISKYGTDSTKYLDNNLGIKDFAYTPITAMLPLQNIKDMKFMEANERFMLFYVEPDIENTYGFFAAIIKTERDYALYIPEFRNTFNIDEDGNVSLFNPNEEPELFGIDNNNTAAFTQLSIPALELAINFALAPIKRTLLTPQQFGTIKNTMPVVTKDSMFLKVGMITSNESPEAILLKKDAELDLNEVTFPLYFNFGRVVDRESLVEIANVLFKANLNECPLLRNCELKYTNDHRLYIDVDLGEF